MWQGIWGVLGEGVVLIEMSTGGTYVWRPDDT